MIKINIDKDINIIATAVNPFDRIGPEEYLSNYNIVGVENGSWMKYAKEQGAKIISLKDISPNIEYLAKTDEIVNTKEFLEVAKQFTNPYVFIYKQSENITNTVVNKYKFNILANKYEITTKLENKVYFREMFGNLVKMPEFRIVETSEVDLNQEFYYELNQKWGKFVLQDEELSGGKGTFIINSYDDFAAAVDKLKDYSRKIVFSQFIKGKVSSIQCCATKYGNVCTGVQQQIISDPNLVDKAAGDGVFCGGQFGYEQFNKSTIDEAVKYGNIIGEEVYKLGYKGLYGLDIIIAENGEVFVLEMNARITGLSLIIMMLQSDQNEIPLQLLNILELGGFEYSIDNPQEFEQYPYKVRKGSYMLLMNKFENDIRLKGSLKPGVYKYNNNNIEFVRDGFRLKEIKEDDEFIITATPNPTTVKYPGKRILRIISRDRAMDQNDKLTEKFVNVVKFIESNFEVLESSTKPKVS